MEVTETWENFVKLETHFGKYTSSRSVGSLSHLFCLWVTVATIYEIEVIRVQKHHCSFNFLNGESGAMFVGLLLGNILVRVPISNVILMVSIGLLPCSLSAAAGSDVVEVAAGCCCEAATSACTSASRSRFLRSRLT